MRNSQIEKVFKEKLTKHKDDPYGIYLSLESDAEEPWEGIIGMMPPPYNLGIILVTYENADPDNLKKLLLKSLFEDQIKDRDDASKTLTRGELAQRNNVRIIKQAVEAKSIAEMTLKEVKMYVRYTFVDHLSDSSIAAVD